GGADLEFWKTVEDIELGQRDAGDARDLHRLAHHHRIEPTAAPLAPGDDAELLAARAQQLAGRVLEFGRERPAADAGGVGLGNAQHEADGARPDASPRRRLAGMGM